MSKLFKNLKKFNNKIALIGLDEKKYSYKKILKNAAKTFLNDLKSVKTLTSHSNELSALAKLILDGFDSFALIFSFSEKHFATQN